MKPIRKNDVFWVSTQESHKRHSLIVAFIKSPWWKMLCYLCLYNNKNRQIALCNSLLWVNDNLGFHFSIVDYCTLMQFDNLFCNKDITSKAFFTMATLLMPLLENGVSLWFSLPFSIGIAEKTYSHPINYRRHFHYTFLISILNARVNSECL